MSDIQRLFAALNVKPRETAAESTSQPTEQRSFVPNNAPATDPTSPPPQPFRTFSQTPTHPDYAAASSPTNGTANNEKTQNLLSLLNFGRPSSAATVSTTPPILDSVARPSSQNINSSRYPQSAPKIASSDFAASFNLPAAASPPEHQPSQSTVQQTQNNPQDTLLKLLNRSHTLSTQSSQDIPEAAPVSTARASAGGRRELSVASNGHNNIERKSSPIRMFGSSESREPTPFEAPKAETVVEKVDTQPLFTYKNPFEALNASRKSTPNPSNATQVQPASTLAKSIERNHSPNPEFIGQAERDLPMHTRKILTPKIPKHNSGQGLSTAPVPTSLPQRENAEPFPRIESVPPALSQGLPPTESEEPQDVPETIVKQEEQDDPFVNPAIPPYQEPIQNQEPSADDNPDNWEDAEDSPKESSTRDVPVYNFPIKPFVSIILKAAPPSKVGIRDDGVMEISKLKKEFDQLDRTLAAATSKYISYALKNGGIRVIRQDDGSDRSVFKNSHDRCFNVAFCTTALSSATSNHQALLGTGLSGAVYYATISKENTDLFEENILDSESLIFPAYPSGDENSSGGVLKTRAKRSSRHPEFFGLGRGRSIHLIWPATAMSPRYGITGANKVVDTEKLFRERSLRITTGKAGKDFAFSEDDTLIASLDKSGRLRFWDIRSLTNEQNAIASEVSPVEIDTPLLSLATASPAEKSWPTSVMFLDKSRPYAKNAALRYVLIGLKQNHTLQLWDIALGKAVQELNFPHEAETDGICSVAYHPSSGIIVVGHPTRNSIYFIHLSAPRYALQPMSQALYVHRLAAKDPDLPKPDATACMSGIREMSFAAKGHLRSLELLPVQKSTDSTKAAVDGSTIFELYAVHSKGVTCLHITKDDLGWTSDSKVINLINAVEAGVITTKELKLGSIIDESTEQKQSAEDQPSSSKSSKKKANKKSSSGETSASALNGDAALPTIELPRDDSATESRAIDPTTSQPPLTKKAKKRAAAAAAAAAAKDQDAPARNESPSKLASVEIPTQSETPLEAEKMTSSKDTSQLQTKVEEGVKADTVTVGISGDWLDRELKKIEKGVAAEFKTELDRLFRHLQNDRNVQDSAAVARHEAVLRLVSTMLSTNIEQTLSQIINTQMQHVVVPALTSVTVQTVSAHVGDAVAKTLHQRLSSNLEAHLPAALDSAVQNPHFQRGVSESVSQKLSAQISRTVQDMLSSTIIPSFKSLAVSAAEKAAADVEIRLTDHIRRLEAERAKDSEKIDSLSKVLVGIASTMEAMSESQVAFQGQILRERRHLHVASDVGSETSARRVPTHHQLPALASSPPVTRPSAEDIEIDEISQLMLDAKYEEGSVRWLQSSRQAILFDRVFVRYTPDFLVTDVSPLVAFSVAITVGNSLSTNILRRLSWIGTAFQAVDFRDPELADLSQHAPGLLNSLVQKLESLYMQTREQDPNDPILREIQPVMRRARSMMTESLEAQPHMSQQRYNYG